MMWGDPETAANLTPANGNSDSLSLLLLQVTGPAHIPWNDPRWQELLLAYDVWVHVDHNRLMNDDLITMACTSMAKHAIMSSNLASLAWHVARMTKEWAMALLPLVENDIDDETATAATAMTRGNYYANNNSYNNDNNSTTTSSLFTNQIALVGKARATAGAMHLLRIFIHDIDPTTLGDVLVYTSRDVSDKDHFKQSGQELIGALLTLLSIIGPMIEPLERVPEIYDATVNCLELLIVLLSTQLYQPMLSSTQKRNQKRKNVDDIKRNQNYVLDYIMEQAQQKRHHNPNSHHHHNHVLTWTPQSILQTCLLWITQRPKAPERSISFHMAYLAESVVEAKGTKKGPDGMYETHMLVLAEKPFHKNNNAPHEQSTMLSSPRQRSSSVLLDATRGVLVLSSSILLLPFRLMNLALGLLGRRKGPNYDTTRKEHFAVARPSGRTNDVLWLTKSPVADLTSALLLLLINNYRVHAAVGKNANTGVVNPFRAELASLNDNRWDEPSDPLATENHQHHTTEVTSLNSCRTPTSKQLLTTNFEDLFVSFGSIVHTEVGALLLYSLFQSSPIFAASVAVRSDLDTLVLPLLRTLYFASSPKYYSGSMQAGRITQDGSTVSIRNCPFRSSSQLYVIMILLLLFSQDASFGPDAFRRVTVATVPWHKERMLKNVSLGSLILLTLLRAIVFNLNRLQDGFLLSNCCAVLMNLSPHVVQLNDYAAMRLASVTASFVKKYAAMVTKNGGKKEPQDDLSSLMGMYGEVSRTLLRLIQHCTSPRNIDKNSNLVYALVYHQTDFKVAFSKKDVTFDKKETLRVQMVIEMADKLIQDNGEARTAPKALKVLRESMEALKEAAKGSLEKEESDFTFSYEEEADPEIFFVPYIWEVIVCVLTSSTIDWDSSRIKVFPLLEEEIIAGTVDDDVTTASALLYSGDVDDVV